MAINYDKLLDLDYTAWGDADDFLEELRKEQIEPYSITVEKRYDENDVPNVVVRALDLYKEAEYEKTYPLDNVTREEFEEVMFDIWESTMKELET